MRRKDCDGVGCIKAKTLFFPDRKTGKNKKAKGLTKSMKNKSLRHENFLKCLKTGESQSRKQCLFRSRDHHIFTENMVKVALSCDDDKRIVLGNGIDTLSLGHALLKASLEK